MAVKTVEMVRKIRDRNFEATRKLTKNKQIQFIRRKAELLHKEVAKKQQVEEKGKAPAPRPKESSLGPPLRVSNSDSHKR